MECGLRPSSPADLTAFRLDPDIKSEQLRFRRQVMAKRKGSQFDWFSLAWQSRDMPRAFSGLEISDGTLQFICLAAALCTPQPPPLLVLNEPETSLSEHVLPAIADLVEQAARHSQILVVTHSEVLSRLIAEKCKTREYELVMRFGETRLRGQEHAKTSILIFDDEDEQD